MLYIYNIYKMVQMSLQKFYGFTMESSTREFALRRHREEHIYIYISSSQGSHAWLWILLVSTFPNESLMYHRSLYNNNIMCDNKHSVNANIIQD